MKSPGVGGAVPAWGSPRIARLLDIPKFGQGIGLHRMEALCAEIREGSWMAGLDALKVTGSNGKGSVCAMAASILSALGIHHGLYISPHLIRFHERMVADGRPISDPDLEEAVDWLLERRESYEREHPDDHVGAFEAFTAVALHWFAKLRPETVVAEAGIGGRYDPVRIVPGDWVGLTSIDLEHTEILGPTLELIAYDKADLCSDGGTLVLGEMDGEVLRRLEAYCRLRSIRAILACQEMRPLQVRHTGMRMVVDFETAGGRLNGLEIGLLGRHQVSNAAVAALLVRGWLARHRPGLAPEDFEAGLRRGLANVTWPGRLQRVSDNPEVFIDVGHTPGAIAALVEAVRTILAGRRLFLVTGVSYNKQFEDIVTRLAPLADRILCTRAYHKGSPVEVIEQIARRVRPDIPVTAEERIEDAMARALEIARTEGMTVLVAGGLFLSMEAAQAVRGEDPQALRFF